MSNQHRSREATHSEGAIARFYRKQEQYAFRLSSGRSAPGKKGRKAKIFLLLAAFLFLSSASIQGPLFHPAAAAAATDPPSSVTVLAGCTYFSSLRFTNNVPQYVT